MKTKFWLAAIVSTSLLGAGAAFAQTTPDTAGISGPTGPSEPHTSGGMMMHHHMMHHHHMMMHHHHMMMHHHHMMMHKKMMKSM